MRLRFAGVADPATGTTRWKLKGWPATAAEPDGWTLQVDDATPSLQGAGAAGLRSSVGRSVTVQSVTIAVDDLVMLAADATTGEADPVIAGAGDIATCDSSGAVKTAALLDRIPGTVMAVGDLADPDGTATQFRDCYDPTWGRFRDRTIAVPGDRDHATPKAAGYFGYWGDQGAAPGGWQAVDLDVTGLVPGDIDVAMDRILPPPAERHRSLVRLRLGGIAGLATRAAIDAALERAAGELVWVDVIEDGLATEPDERDLASLADVPATAVAARTLQDAAATGSDEERATARLALRYLYAEAQALDRRA